MTIPNPALSDRANNKYDTLLATKNIRIIEMENVMKNGGTVGAAKPRTKMKATNRHRRRFTHQETQKTD